MDFIIADSDKKDLCFLDDSVSLDFDIGDTDDFEMTIVLTDYDAQLHSAGNILYCLGNEYGGILNDPEINTKDNEITFTGDTFRGMLKKKCIEPPSGEDYYTISGELNECINEVVGKAFSENLFKVSDSDTGVSLTYSFNRYCTMLDGLTKMLATVSYRLSIKAVREDSDFYIELSAVPIVDYSEDVEFSQDNDIYFKIQQITNKYNYMIALGKGELQEREVLYFYCDEDGNVSSVDAIPQGDDVKVYIYENTSSEDLETDAIEKWEEVNSEDEYEMTIDDDIEIELGDIVGGRDYITGMTISEPITRKIIKYSNNNQTISYEIGG